MHIPRVTSYFVVLAIFVTTFVSRSHAATPTFTLAEQEVIEALLAQEIETKRSKKHIITDTTSVMRLHMSKSYGLFATDLRQQSKQRDGAFKEALEDFLQKNKTAIQIVFPTNATESVQLVSSNVTTQIFAAKHDAKPSGWDVFYQRFPDSGGLVTISRVGIDSRGTVAIVYLGQQSQYLAGSGRIRILKREGLKWVSTYEIIGPQWVS